MSPRPRRLLAFVSGVVALVAFGLAIASTRTSAGTDVEGDVSVAVLSPRRVPEVLRDVVAQTRLVSRISSFAATLSPTSCLSVSVGDASVFARNPDLPLTPASSLKLTTGAAFLAARGGKDRFTTLVRGSRPVQGVVNWADARLVK